jgi:hypothetical protein
MCHYATPKLIVSVPAVKDVTLKSPTVDVEDVNPDPTVILKVDG